MDETIADRVEYLKDELTQAIKEHSPVADSWLHNGGTAVALAATTAATIIPTSSPTLAKVTAGIATFVIAISRALDFGGRWRWHIAMRARYAALLNRVEEMVVLPADEQLAAVKDVFNQLVALRGEEDRIPGAGDSLKGQA